MEHIAEQLEAAATSCQPASKTAHSHVVQAVNVFRTRFEQGPLEHATHAQAQQLMDALRGVGAAVIRLEQRAQELTGRSKAPAALTALRPAVAEIEVLRTSPEYSDLMRHLDIRDASRTAAARAAPPPTSPRRAMPFLVPCRR